MPNDTFTTFDGGEYTVLERPAGPSDPLVMRFRLPNECGAPPLHVHPKGTETFAVEEGSFELCLGGDWRELGAGESVTVEVGQPHTFRNISGAEVVVRNTHDPHHDFERYLRTIAAISHEIEATAPNSPTAAIKLARTFAAYPDLIRPAQPAMRVALPVLAGVGQILRVGVPEPAV